MQKTKPEKIILSIVFAFSLFLPYMLALAKIDTGIIPCDGVETECGICQIFELISNIVNFAALYIAAPLGALILIYGGVMMVISPANEEGIKKGKNALSAAIWGLFITFAAWVMINAILGALASKPFSESWYQFPGCS